MPDGGDFFATVDDLSTDVACSSCGVVWFTISIGEPLMVSTDLYCPNCRVPLCDTLDVIER